MFVSAKVPLFTYSKSTSMSYVVGYVISAIVSLRYWLLLWSSNSLFLVFVLALITYGYIFDCNIHRKKKNITFDTIYVAGHYLGNAQINNRQQGHYVDIWHSQHHISRS